MSKAQEPKSYYKTCTQKFKDHGKSINIKTIKKKEIMLYKGDLAVERIKLNITPNLVVMLKIFQIK